MKFTSYYSKVVKAQGVPHLSPKELFRLMNILFIEASMHALDKLPCEGKSQSNKNEALFKLKYQLENLTQKQPPEQILQSMVEHSQ